MPEWLKGVDCKSTSYAYVGSNPTRPNLSYSYFRPSVISKRYDGRTMFLKINLFNLLFPSSTDRFIFKFLSLF